MKNKNPLGYEPVFNLIIKYSIPSIISMLVMTLYNIVDQIFIGHLIGIMGNAATNITFPIITLTAAFSQMIGMGTAANFNINIGANKEEEAKQIVGAGILLMGILGIFIMSSVLIFKDDILILCGVTDTILPYAQLYLDITVLGLPFLLFTNSLSTLIRADGSPKYSMFCTIIGAILNIFLDWIFMVKFRLGIQGAAFATIICQFISFIICIAYLPKFKTFSINFNIFNLKLKYIIKIIKLGTSNFINQIIMMLVNILLNNMLKKYGAISIYGSEIPLAVSGIAAKLNSILTAFSVGIAQGCQPILGFNMGAKNYNRVKEIYKKSLYLSLIIGIIIFTIFQLFPVPLISIFGSGEALYFDFAKKYIRIYMMMVCIFSIQPITVNYFTGIGNTKQGIILSLSRQGFFLIPLLLTLPTIFGINGILFAGPVSDTMACILALSMVIYNFKEIDKANILNNK